MTIPFPVSQLLKAQETHVIKLAFKLISKSLGKRAILSVIKQLTANFSKHFKKRVSWAWGREVLGTKIVRNAHVIESC